MFYRISNASLSLQLFYFHHFFPSPGFHPSHFFVAFLFLISLLLLLQMVCFLSFSLHYPISLHLCRHAGASETERRLHQKLFENYNMKVRPARYWEEKVTVRVGMTLSQLVSLVNEQHKQCANMCPHMQTKYSTSYQLRIQDRPSFICTSLNWIFSYFKIQKYYSTINEMSNLFLNLQQDYPNLLGPTWSLKWRNHLNGNSEKWSKLKDLKQQHNMPGSNETIDIQSRWHQSHF